MRKGISDQGIKRLAKSVEATTDSQIWDMADRCRELMGDDEFIEALLKAMSTEEAQENLDFIMRMYDISMEDVEEEY